jgi:hypothetical protein
MLFAAVVAVLLGSSPAFAQSGASAPPLARSIDLAGPRIGVTFLSQGVIDKLAERNVHVSSMISQFGWQIERQFYTKSGGITALHEWIGLIGGMDQGVAIPSLSWMVGLRTADGTEFGVGPNLTPAGVALVFSAGVTLRTGVLNVPMNFAVVPTKAGVRVSLLTGFTLRR